MHKLTIASNSRQADGVSPAGCKQNLDVCIPCEAARRLSLDCAPCFIMTSFSFSRILKSISRIFPPYKTDEDKKESIQQEEWIVQIKGQYSGYLSICKENNTHNMMLKCFNKNTKGKLINRYWELGVLTAYKTTRKCNIIQANFLGYPRISSCRENAIWGTVWDIIGQ